MQKTITDFGEQWLQYQDNDGYYGSKELLCDILGPTFNASEIQDKTILDVGAGTGKNTALLLALGAARIIAIEPSSAFTVLQSNLAKYSSRVDFKNIRGDQIDEHEVDCAVCIGVLHHIADPGPVLNAIYRSLKPNGSFFLWVYGAEGNELYLALSRVLRTVTTRLPHPLLACLSWALTFPFSAYGSLCKVFSLPLARYFRSVFLKLSLRKRMLVIYDQLNPKFAHYYRREEIVALVEKHGFTVADIYHRHGYSWTLKLHPRK